MYKYTCVKQLVASPFHKPRRLMERTQLASSFVPSSPSLPKVGNKRRHADPPRVSQAVNGGLNNNVVHDLVDNGGSVGVGILLGDHAVNLDEGHSNVVVFSNREEDCATTGHHGSEHGSEFALLGRSPTEAGNGRSQAGCSADWASVSMVIEHPLVAALTESVPDTVPAVARKRVDYGALASPGVKRLVAYGAVVSTLLVTIRIVRA